ncbi:DUF6527 family protein [Aquipuribacter hungaricus]|uniref:DUF6527 family protein n=1 Tax=Aquipuribacter hungaricus TaxID=545624 RepID=A0ABV7WGF6_9MICO
MIAQIRPVLVTTVPAQPEPGVLYVSVEYATTLHLCACGCGHEVVLGISPHDWTLNWDGETVSLDHSVGNWSFPCQSHYCIRRNRIVRAGPWTDEQITRGRARDAAFRRGNPTPAVPDVPSAPSGSWLLRWLRRLPHR